jgi:hypothetical protein
MIKSQLLDYQRLMHFIQLDSADFWIMTLLKWSEIGSRVASSTQCDIRPFHEELMIVITGPNEVSLQNAKSIVEDEIGLIKKTNVVMDLPQGAFSAFAGRNNTNMTTLARDHGVSIERLKKNANKILIHGDDLTSVLQAIADWVQVWEKKHAKTSAKESAGPEEHKSTMLEKSAVGNVFQTNENSVKEEIVLKNIVDNHPAFAITAEPRKLIATSLQEENPLVRRTISFFSYQRVKRNSC